MRILILVFLGKFEIRGAMGNFGKPLNFPLVWTRKGAVEPRRIVTGIVQQSLLAKRGIVHNGLRAQHIEW